MELTLNQAEERLSALLDAGDETGWQAMAGVLGQVEDGGLWKEGGWHSYSAWIKSFAQKVGKSESLLWKYGKARKAYRAAVKAVPSLPPMAETKASAEAVITAEKICGDDVKALAGLIDKVECGKLRARDLREMWKSAKKVTGVRTNRHQAKPSTAATGGDAEMTRKLTDALAAQAGSWIWGAETPSEVAARKMENRARDFLTRDAICVKTLTEFPVRVEETAERARQIDLAAVTAENQTTADWMEVNLHGVEVKVSLSDFERDQKMGDYALFMDYMYLAVPLDLVAEVQDGVPVEWGLLGYDPEADCISVVREPERLDAPRREQALMTAIVKLSRREVK